MPFKTFLCNKNKSFGWYTTLLMLVFLRQRLSRNPKNDASGQRHIQNAFKQLRWRILQKQLTVFSFSQSDSRKTNFESCARQLQKISCKTLHRKTYIYFREFAYNILSKIDETRKPLNWRALLQ